MRPARRRSRKTSAWPSGGWIQRWQDLIAQENVRPLADYQSAGRLPPAAATPYVVAHLQLSDDGLMTSPQLRDGAAGEPQKDLRAALRSVADGVTSNKLAERLPPPTTAVADQNVFFAESDAEPPAAGQTQQSRGAREFHSRSRYLQANAAFAQNTSQTEASNVAAAGMAGGVMTPRWLDGRLLLLRRVSLRRQEYLQICWLDSPSIQAWLADLVRDLLPDARVVEAPAATEVQLTRLLAALPLLLVPGELPPASAEPLSALRWSLLVAWMCVLLAAAAVGALLAGVVSLSERRAAFVSAVTHELRTPLTTFRMYAEMLAEGMVSGESQRRSYLDTLRSEAERLGHLVDNVLTYARLERRRTIAAGESIAVGELIDRMQPRLAERCGQANMELAIEASPEIRDRELRTNVGSVEQIVFNLVDNACKYASSAADRRIQLAATVAGNGIRLSVADHGPGMARQTVRRLFRPFGKSAEVAARSAPGVGLGLALSRRLARQLGGRLVLERNGGGATFALLLPARSL